jgi:hypothetical protein
VGREQVQQPTLVSVLSANVLLKLRAEKAKHMLSSLITTRTTHAGSSKYQVQLNHLNKCRRIMDKPFEPSASPFWTNL